METREIPLTRGKVALVGAEDYEDLIQYNWQCSKNGYAARSVRVNGKKKALLMHRVITNAPEGSHVDHIDGDGLNNQRSNLRVATCSQNLCNQKLRKANTSGFKGVSFDPVRRKFQSYITIEQRCKFLGRFNTAEEAARAYDNAALQLHGEFAYLNFAPEMGQENNFLFPLTTSKKNAMILTVEAESL